MQLKLVLAAPFLKVYCISNDKANCFKAITNEDLSTSEIKIDQNNSNFILVPISLISIQKLENYLEKITAKKVDENKAENSKEYIKKTNQNSKKEAIAEKHVEKSKETEKPRLEERSKRTESYHYTLMLLEDYINLKTEYDSLELNYWKLVFNGQLNIYNLFPKIDVDLNLAKGIITTLGDRSASVYYRYLDSKNRRIYFAAKYLYLQTYIDEISGSNSGIDTATIYLAGAGWVKDVDKLLFLRRFKLNVFLYYPFSGQFSAQDATESLGSGYMIGSNIKFGILDNLLGFAQISRLSISKDVEVTANLLSVGVEFGVW